ncbi:cell death-inducing p53-target protein 1 homolog isoform X2 [Pleurodeles waltl]|uniref:cell death-inducing p53-target protein 1 homolog isoform X2 n=1 Tax=Pleurodeles waltl TaxID=8319 RepID=UPI00370983FA
MQPPKPYPPYPTGYAPQPQPPPPPLYYPPQGPPQPGFCPEPQPPYLQPPPTGLPLPGYAPQPHPPPLQPPPSGLPQPGYSPQPHPPPLQPPPSGLPQPGPPMAQQGGTAQGGQNQTVIMQPPVINQTIVMGNNEKETRTPQAPPIIIGQAGDTPMRTTCPACQQQIMTNISHVPGGMAWIICAVLAVLGFWLCCFIPFLVPSCQDVNHYCPYCRHLVAKYNRL